jgi:hypothetical protein
MQLGRFALRDLLLGAQIAICTLLVTSSLVAVRGMERALHVPLGFQPQGAVLVDMDLSQSEPSDDLLLKKQKSIMDAARSIPGVSAVGIVSHTPFTGGMHGVPIFRPGTTDFKLNNAALAPYVFQMSPGYLAAANTSLLSGRDVSWQDTHSTPYVAVVNHTFAQKMWGDAQPSDSTSSCQSTSQKSSEWWRTVSTTIWKNLRSLLSTSHFHKEIRATRSSSFDRSARPMR